MRKGFELRFFAAGELQSFRATRAVVDEDGTNLGLNQRAPNRRVSRALIVGARHAG